MSFGLNRKCNHVMEDGFRCNRPFRVNTGLSNAGITKCEEHRVKVNKSGLVRDSRGSGNRHVKAINQKAMHDFVVEQMEKQAETQRLFDRVKQLERMFFHSEENESEPRLKSRGVSEESLENLQQGRPELAVEKEFTYMTLNSSRFNKKMEEALKFKITSMFDAHEHPFMKNLATVNSRVNSGMENIETFRKSTKPLINKMAEKADKLEAKLENMEKRYEILMNFLYELLQLNPEVEGITFAQFLAASGISPAVKVDEDGRNAVALTIAKPLRGMQQIIEAQKENEKLVREKSRKNERNEEEE